MSLVYPAPPLPEPPQQPPPGAPPPDVPLAPSADRAPAGTALLGLSIAGQIVTFVVAGAVGILFLVDRGATDSSGETVLKSGPWVQVGGLVPMWVAMVAVVLVAHRKLPQVTILQRPRFARSDLGWFGLGLLSQVVVGLLYLPFHVDQDKLEKPARDLIDSAKGQPVGFAALALCIVVGAPLVEELFYRGLVWTGIDAVARTSRLGARAAGVVATVVSGAWFAGIHFELLQLPGLLLVGIVCGVARARSKRLGASILYHLGFNVVTVAALGAELWSSF